MKNKNSNIASLVFVGFMFLGGGIGMLFKAAGAGGAIGMGLGFIAMAVVLSKGKVEEEEK